MDSGKYKDFFDNKNPNTIWAFDVDKNGENVFKPVVLKNAAGGDTDSIYSSLPQILTEQMTQDEIVEASDIIAENVNSAYPEFLERVFNCPKERNDSMVSEREIVADKALLLTKKRYAMHIINDEGTPCDQYKVMGLEIKKSDTSPLLKEFLMDIVKRILDEQDREQLKEAIAGYKDRFYSASMTEIAIPCGCKTLNKLYQQLKDTGSIKGMHYVSRAAYFYNQQCGEKDQRVRSGDKVGVVYINNPHSKYIGYPLDARNLPDWIDSFSIDYDTMWEKVDKKITNYMASMGWDLKTVRRKKKAALFGMDEEDLK